MADPEFLAWNRTIEEEVDQLFANPPTRKRIDDALTTTSFSRAETDRRREATRFTRRQVAKLQKDFRAQLVEEARAAGPWQQLWHKETRQREILEVTLEIMFEKNSPYVDDRRLISEIKLSTLLERNGEGIVDLMPRLAQRGPGADGINWLDNPGFDAMVGTERDARTIEQRDLLERLRVDRSRTIQQFVLLVYGLVAEGTSPEAAIAMYKAAENASDLNPMAPGTVSNSKGKKSNITSGSVYCCVSGTPPRNWYYCSRECQLRDWKAGHRRDCGKAPASAPIRTFEDPTPAPRSVRRTIALDAQMETIKNPPGDYKIVYVILTNATFIHLQHSAIVKHSKDRLAEFYKYRQRAFDNPSDLEAITQIYIGVHSWMSFRKGVPGKDDGLSLVAIFRRQIMREYEVDVDDLLDAHYAKTTYYKKPQEYEKDIAMRSTREVRKTCTSALRRQLEALDGPEDVSYYVFTPSLPDGFPVRLHPFVQSGIDDLRRLAVCSHHPRAVGELYMVLFKVLFFEKSAADLPPFVNKDLENQLAAEFDMPFKKAMRAMMKAKADMFAREGSPDLAAQTYAQMSLT